jgi:hypothetical protein
MQADGEPAAPATGPILDEIAALARFEDAQAESREVIIPQKIIRLPGSPASTIRFVSRRFLYQSKKRRFHGSTTAALGGKS